MKKAFLFLVIIFFVNVLGLYRGWGLNYSWFDQVLHFSGGFFVAMLFSIYLKNHLPSDAKLKNALVLISVVAFIGVIWEFAEYLAGQILIEPIYKNFDIKTYFIGDIDDTINDLLMDILGAILFVFSSRTKLIR